MVSLQGDFCTPPSRIFISLPLAAFSSCSCYGCNRWHWGACARALDDFLIKQAVSVDALTCDGLSRSRVIACGLLLRRHSRQQIMQMVACLCVYICVYVCLYMCVYLFAYVCVRLCMCAFIILVVISKCITITFSFIHKHLMTRPRQVYKLKLISQLIIICQCTAYKVWN